MKISLHSDPEAIAPRPRVSQAEDRFPNSDFTRHR